MPIIKFEILGERCSGTNFLEECLTNNFNIKYEPIHGHKHFFCYNNYDKTSTDNILFIGIIRNPIYWLNSFSKELHHVSPENKKNLYSFLFSKFYSIHDQECNGLNCPVNLRDLNYKNNKFYKNIFELRQVKNDYLLNVVPKKVKNYILINYEDLLFNFDNTMKIIRDRFNLKMTNKEFVKEKKYKKSDTYNFVKQREITFPPGLVKIIWSKLDIKQEISLGYYPGNGNNYFINKKETNINSINDL